MESELLARAERLLQIRVQLQFKVQKDVLELRWNWIYAKLCAYLSATTSAVACVYNPGIKDVVH